MHSNELKYRPSAVSDMATLLGCQYHDRYWHQVLSRCGRLKAGARLCLEADRLGFAKADERIANVDGATWIRRQLVSAHHDHS